MAMERMSGYVESGKKSRKSHHRECQSCRQPLPDDYIQDRCTLCGPGRVSSPNTDTRHFIQWFKSQMSSTFGKTISSTRSAPCSRKRKRRSCPVVVPPSSTSSSTKPERAVSVSSSDDEGEDHNLFDQSKTPKLVKAVKGAVESGKASNLPKKNLPFFFPRNENRNLPVHPVISKMLVEGWEKPERKLDLGSRFKSLYRVDPSVMEKWENPPKPDLPVVKLVSKAIFPSEEYTKLKEPMDRKADSLLKNSYVISASACKVAMAAVPVSRALRIWLSQITRDLQDGVPREDIIKNMALLQSASSFLADAHVDSLRLAAKNLAVANSARRALWIKAWSGDTRLKNYLCSLPFQPESMFGTQLEDFIKSLWEYEEAELPQPKKKPSFRPFWSRSRRYPKNRR
ncbi:uncharacterized protein LOC130291273 isoform X2 [Hyla sarda]|uniref:uncharacterized protein LOC130291273 isoform X2 n=1 Tax=Hyla sarda TaxID=327740 RepID=UPI0024C37EF3|nr:uncharacterized protein LOC130291273 isoform X2 [Hyla sarda]